MNRPPFYTALGISTGDIVTTSYGTGPYEVWRISEPRRFEASFHCIAIWPHPVIGLTVIRTDHVGIVRDVDLHWINEVRREGDSWFSSGAEIFVHPANASKPIQRSIFDLPDIDSDDPPSYPFQPGVDYQSRGVWHCQDCGLDYDTSRVTGEYGPRTASYYPRCPDCDGWPRPIVWVGQHTNSYIGCLNA